MDRLNRSTRAGFTCALALLVLGASAAEFKANLRARVLPDLFTHLSNGDRNVEEGNPQAALACADVVLLKGVVKFHVAFDGIDPRRQAACSAAVTAGIAAWVAGLDSDTRFELVDKAEDADVRVTYVRRLEIDGRAVGGRTQWRRAVKSLGDGACSAVVTATVHLVADCPDGRAMSASQMRQASCHEFGHILGLQDSPRQGDVMGPLELGKPVAVPSLEEVEALIEIRDEARQLRGKALALVERKSAAQ